MFGNLARPLRRSNNVSGGGARSVTITVAPVAVEEEAKAVAEFPQTEQPAGSPKPKVEEKRDLPPTGEAPEHASVSRGSTLFGNLARPLRRSSSVSDGGARSVTITVAPVAVEEETKAVAEFPQTEQPAGSPKPKVEEKRDLPPTGEALEHASVSKRSTLFGNLARPLRRSNNVSGGGARSVTITVAPVAVEEETKAVAEFPQFEQPAGSPKPKVEEKSDLPPTGEALEHASVSKRSTLFGNLARPLRRSRSVSGGGASAPALASLLKTQQRDQTARDAVKARSSIDAASSDVGSGSLAESNPLAPRHKPERQNTFSKMVGNMGSVADAGTHITWISPTPVKVNGHFCDIFAGTHTTVGKVALKRPRIGAAGNNEDIMRRFQREAETWARLQHPHILEYLGTFQRDGYFYFVSPFIENGTLVEYITVHLSVNRVKLLRDTADAIAYLHQQDVVHGDIKASNILIGNDGQVLLCDFGLTRTTDFRTSTAMKGAGTLRWQGPELWNGGSKSFKSDVFAFGMTIVEVLTGDVPFPDLQTDGAVICAVLIEARRPPKSPAESSAGLSYANVWAVAEACWPAGPDERISMSDALQLIQKDPALAGLQNI